MWHFHYKLWFKSISIALAAQTEVSGIIMKHHLKWDDWFCYQPPFKIGPSPLIKLKQCSYIWMYKTKNYSKIVAHFHQWDFICNQLKITSTQFSWCGPLAQEAFRNHRYRCFSRYAELRSQELRASEHQRKTF